MAKVQIDQTPSDKITKKNPFQNEVIDEEGRIFQLRMPDALDEFNLYAALGNDSNNMGCVTMAMALMYISSIDGDKFNTPRSMPEIRAGLKILGRAGLKAITAAVQEHARVESEGEKIEEIKK